MFFNKLEGFNKTKGFINTATGDEQNVSLKNEKNYLHFVFQLFHEQQYIEVATEYQYLFDKKPPVLFWYYLE